MKNSSSFTPPHLTNVNKQRYNSLDGLRAYAAIGIVLMHVLANISTQPSKNYLTTSIIPFFSDFTLLFMMVSGFSLCCGYYDRIKNGTITPNVFYKKRYARILPYFGCLCLLDFALEPQLTSLYELVANLTLCFNLLPNPNIKMIGVGWFLGVVFLFYMLFPFFVFMIDNKGRAWKSITISLIFAFAAMNYFYSPEFVVKSPGKVNIVFCAPIFLFGGILYLYRKVIFSVVHEYNKISALLVLGLTIVYFAIKSSICNSFLSYLIEISMFALWLIYAIGAKDVVLNNKIVKYLSAISMEIYLAHMVIFRVVQLLHIERFIQQPDFNYICTCLLVLVGVIGFAHIMKYYVLAKVVKLMEK